MYCRSLDITPTVPLFRDFYKLCKQGNWFSFQNRVGKNCKPCLKDAPTSLKKGKDKFFLVDRRAVPIAMAWRYHDSSVADPFPKLSEYNASDVTKLREVIIGLRKPPPSLLYVVVVSMAEFLRLPNFKGCKVAAGALLPPTSAWVTHLANPIERLEEIPHMVTAELPYRKVLDDKKKKKRKAEAKAAANAPDVDIQVEKVAGKRGVGKDNTRKKRRVRLETPMQSESEHVSFLVHLNHAHPIKALANKEHVSTDASAGKDQENVDHAFANEGHGDNDDRLSDLHQRLESVEKLTCDKVVPDVAASYSAWHFGNLPFTPQWGLTESCRIDNSSLCQDMMSNLFTPQQANTLLRFDALREEHANLVYAYESCKDMKVRYKKCKKELAKLQSGFDEKVLAYGHLSQNYDAVLTRKQGLQDRVEELKMEEDETEEVCAKQTDRIKQLEAELNQSEVDAHQLHVDREKFIIECGQGEMVRRRIINKYLPTFNPDIQAILKPTPNVDPASSDTFMETYEKLFDKRYPYVDKVARVYLLDPTGLQNVMPDETGLTPGGGPRDTPTASYA
ncbi:hypothetical protein Tco_0111152 [Tanacetum coccineum]